MKAKLWPDNWNFESNYDICDGCETGICYAIDWSGRRLCKSCLEKFILRNHLDKSPHDLKVMIHGEYKSKHTKKRGRPSLDEKDKKTKKKKKSTEVDDVNVDPDYL